MKTLQTILVFSVSALLFAGCAKAGAPGSEDSAVPPTAGADTNLKAIEPFTPDEAVALMDALISSDRNIAQLARDEILARDDPAYIAVMIELLRAAQIGLVNMGDYLAYVQILGALSDESIGDDWADWIEWYGTTDLEPPPGFTGWKGRLLGGIDPRFSVFLSDDAPSAIRVEEILWGGVRVDGIPALDNPTMIPAAGADYLLAEEPVFGIYLQGEARAYPLRILDWHEMANDVIGDQPVSLAYCTLCGAAIAFDGLASDGETYTFGSSGFLFRSNKLMYDRQTFTLWNQLTGEPVLGPLVGQDLQLDILPVVLTSWGEWQGQHPDTMVVALETGYERSYTPGAAYGHYFAADDTMFPVWQRSDLLDTKDRIYAIRLDGQAKAYPLDVLLEQQVVNDTVGETEVVLVAQGEPVIVNAQSLRAGAVTYSAGAEVRAFASGGETFSSGPTVGEVLDSAGQVWTVTEEALVGPGGERFERLGGHLAYWFGWYAFFPNTDVYGLD